MFDSHCHLQFPQYDKDRGEIIKQSLNAGMKMLCVGTDLGTSRGAVNLAKKYENIWASIGFHPNDHLHRPDSLEEYRSLLKEPKAIAVGEIGLDYYRSSEEGAVAAQKDIFIKFLELAREAEKPLILHCRDAYVDMLEMLSSAETLFSGSAVRGVIHSFTSDRTTAKKFLDLGFYIGLNGIITFTDQYDELIKKLPLDSLLLETDAPYLAPVPHRGQRNEPLYIKYVAEKIAEIRNESIEKIVETTIKNAKKLFGA